MAFSCSSCGLPRSDAQVPCPGCGAGEVTVTLDTGAATASGEALVVLEKGEGKKRLRRLRKIWEEIFRKTGRLHLLDQEVDPAKDRYRKRIVDTETGEVLRNEDKPLSEHQGHGSAKRRPDRS